jgi:hypothetical protein
MNEQEIYFNKLLLLSGKIGTLMILLPLFLALIKKTNLNKALKVFVLYCVFAFISGFLLQIFVWSVDNYTTFWKPYLDRWDIHDTNFLAIISYSNNFAILGMYFSKTIHNKKVVFAIISISILLFILAIVDYIFIEGFRQFTIFTSTASAIFCFVLPLIHFWYLFHEDSKIEINKNPYFWIALGLLIPNLIGLFIHFAGNKIYGTDFILYCKIAITRSIIGIVGQIFFAIGFYYARYTKYMPKATQQ